MRFIKILKLSLELTYRVITAAFERSSNMSPNNCKKRDNNIITHQFNGKQYNKSSISSALTCLFFKFILDRPNELRSGIKQAKFKTI